MLLYLISVIAVGKSKDIIVLVLSGGNDPDSSEFENACPPGAIEEPFAPLERWIFR
jgi:hypothetical protein